MCLKIEEAKWKDFSGFYPQLTNYGDQIELLPSPTKGLPILGNC